MITYHFPPAGGSSTPAALRMGKFVKYLPEFGWSPIVLSVDLGVFDMLDNGLVADASTQPVRVKDPIRRFRGYDRLSQYLPSPSLLTFWAVRVAKTAANLIEKYRPCLILASSPPAASLFAGYLIQRKSGLPLILDYRDQWTFNPYRNGRGILRHWDYYLESKILKNSAQVLVTNPGRMAEHQVFWQSLSPEIVVIPNGFDPSDFDKSIQAHGNEVDENLLTIRHMGALYGARAESLNIFLEQLSAYLLSHPSESKIKIELIGLNSPDVVGHFQSSTPRLRVYVKGAVQFKQSLALEFAADALLLIIGRHQQSHAETTSKIFEYMASGRPVLVIGDSQSVREIVSAIPRFFFVGDTYTKDMFDDLFLWLFKQRNSSLAPKNEFDENFNGFTRRSIARSLAGVFDKILTQEGAN